MGRTLDLVVVLVFAGRLFMDMDLQARSMWLQAVSMWIQLRAELRESRARPAARSLRIIVVFDWVL